MSVWWRVSVFALRMLLSLFAVSVALCIQGCSGLGTNSKALDTYDLSVPMTATSGAEKSKVQILIAEPQALKALDSQSIVIRPSGSAIEYLGGAQWGDRLPKIVQTRLVQAFENAQIFGGVGRPGEGLAIDHQIICEIRAFEIRTTGADTAVVELFVKLVNDRNGVVVASRIFKSAVASGPSPDGFVKALDAAFAATMTEIVQWTAQKI